MPVTGLAAHPCDLFHFFRSFRSLRIEVNFVICYRAIRICNILVLHIYVLTYLRENRVNRWGTEVNGSAYLIQVNSLAFLLAFSTWSCSYTRFQQNLRHSHVRSSNFSRSLEIPAVYESSCWLALPPVLNEGVTIDLSTRVWM